MDRLMRTIALLILCGVILAGCTSTRQRLINSGHDPAYAAGYEHGESSGLVVVNYQWATYKKDDHRYDSDAQYHQGWDDGFRAGKAKYEKR